MIIRRSRGLSALAVCLTDTLPLIMPSAALAQVGELPARIWQPAGSSDASDVVGSFMSQTSTTVTLRASEGKTRSLPIATLGDEDLRYLRNLASVTLPYRSWTRRYRDANDWEQSETFAASLVSVEGFDSPLSKRRAVLVRQDTGQRRGYAIGDLGQGDQDYVAAQSAKFPAPPAPHDGPDYAVQYDEYSPTSSPEPYNTFATDHFVWYWGNKIAPNVAQWSAPAFRQMNFRYFEKVWDYFRSLNAPLPGWNTPTKHKTNIYVTSTGLSAYPDGFAFGGKKIVISPAAMLEGASVVPHEFGHTMQLASGGFENNEYVGWLWESHANWGANDFIPGLSLALAVYAEHAHYELDSSRDNYGSWPFLQFFAEHPRFSRDFDFDIWKKALRDKDGNATETPFETMMRLGAQAGVFKEDGLSGFGDMIGEMAAHNVTWDYTYQQAFQDDLRAVMTSGAVYRGRTLLSPVPDRSGWYRPLYSQSPRQYGVNLIDLQISPGATEVQVNLDGIVDETLQSDWRAVLVAIDRSGQPRYSRMWHTGAGHLKLQRSDVKLALAITAAPNKYVRQPFRPGYNKVKRHFPYEVRFFNCSPSTVPVGVRGHEGIAGAPAPNGGGFVAATAQVDSTAYVAPMAQVLDRAQVHGTARIEEHATVADEAVVSESAIVCSYAIVRERAHVAGAARVGGNVAVDGQAIVHENARLREDIHVHGNGVVAGNAIVKGFGDLFTDATVPIGGGAIIVQDAEVYAAGKTSPIDYGTLYGFMGAEQTNRELTDNHYLYAHWDFAQPRKRILIDSFADNDGVLRGGATFATDAGRSVLNLNGLDAYATFEGSAIDAAGITIDLRFRWRGGAANQSVIAFGGPGGALFFTPRDAAGKAAFTIRNGTATETLEASRAIPENAVERVTICFGKEGARIYLDSALIGSRTTFANTLDAIEANAGYLGCHADQTGFFQGALYDIALYRRDYPGAELPNGQ